ncbi:MAG: hypothetical protein CL610_22170 [Anaerolineaceae bacterium]|nr:hypothetical protein [Anaerolineaceae bacterium]
MRKMIVTLLAVCAAMMMTGAAVAQEETEYRVGWADTLDVIGQELDVSVACLAAANELTNVNDLSYGQILIVPSYCDPYDEIESTIISNIEDLTDNELLASGLGQGGGQAESADDEAEAADEDDDADQGGGAAIDAEAMTELPEDEIYVVEAGDNLTKIAEAYEVSAECIQRTNFIINPDLIYTGQELLISGDCLAGGGGDVIPGAVRECFSDRNAGRVVNNGQYVVQAGDTLDFIGCDLGMSTSCLAALNNLPNNGGRLEVGQVLTISSSCAGWDGPPGPGDLMR